MMDLGESCLLALIATTMFLVFQIYSTLSLSFHSIGMLYLDVNSFSGSILTEVLLGAF
jgi:hypothetical protein